MVSIEYESSKTCAGVGEQPVVVSVAAPELLVALAPAVLAGEVDVRVDGALLVVREKFAQRAVLARLL